MCIRDRETGFLNAGVPFGLSNDVGGRGWFGTVQVGCDYQAGSNIVIGAFGDYDFSGIKGDMSLPTLGWVGEEKLKNSWAAGGRIGWVPWTTTQFMWFISGGYTQARFGQVDFFRASDGLSASFNLVKHTYSGWFIGSGYEYGIGWLPGLFWKTEYRFASYDHNNERNVVLGVNAVPGDAITSTKWVQTIKSQLVWRFNFGGF